MVFVLCPCGRFASVTPRGCVPVPFCLGHVEQAQVLFVIVRWYVGAVLVQSQSETIEPKTL